MPTPAPERSTTPPARPRFVLWVPDSQGRYLSTGIDTSPDVRASADPAGLTGLVPGTIIADTTLGVAWVADTSGVPVKATAASIAAMLATANTWAAAQTFPDDLLIVVDPAAPTRRARLDAGAVTAGQTRVVSVPDTDVDLADIAANTLKTAMLTRETTTVGGKVVLAEGSNNGAHTLTIQGPASLAASRTVTFPDTDVDLTTLATHTGQIAALGAENTDGNIDIPLNGTATSGTWAYAITSDGIQTLTRTANAATEYYWVAVPMPHRSSASKGIKPTGLDVNYRVGTADATDITFELWARTLGANGAEPTAAVLFGEDDADYDADHNTAAGRGLDTAAPQLHRAIITNAGVPAYLGGDESLYLRIKVVDPGTSAVVITGAKLRYSEIPNDLA